MACFCVWADEESVKNSTSSVDSSNSHIHSKLSTSTQCCALQRFRASKNEITQYGRLNFITSAVHRMDDSSSYDFGSWGVQLGKNYTEVCVCHSSLLQVTGATLRCKYNENATVIRRDAMTYHCYLKFCLLWSYSSLADYFVINTKDRHGFGDLRESATFAFYLKISMVY